MKDVIRDAILYRLDDVIKAVEEGDEFSLKKLSNYTIHNASIFQDDDSLSFAIVIYSISKLIERAKLNSNDGSVEKSLLINLTKMKKAIAAKKDDLYRQKIANVLKTITKIDEKSSEYFQEVLLKSKIKKGTVMFQHGISIPRVAEALGITEWDLREYVGKMDDIGEKTPSQRVMKRVKYLKTLFGV